MLHWEIEDFQHENHVFKPDQVFIAIQWPRTLCHGYVGGTDAVTQLAPMHNCREDSSPTGRHTGVDLCEGTIEPVWNFNRELVLSVNGQTDITTYLFRHNLFSVWNWSQMIKNVLLKICPPALNSLSKMIFFC